MKLTLLILSLFLVAGSSLAASTAWAEENSQSDFCGTRFDGCLTHCVQYNVTLFGVSFASPRSVACGLECTVAYAGCIMMRFREGV